jgi:hypothetical protein
MIGFKDRLTGCYIPSCIALRSGIIAQRRIETLDILLWRLALSTGGQSWYSKLE